MTHGLVFKTANWSFLLGRALIQTNISGFTGDPTRVLLSKTDLNLDKKHLSAVLFNRLPGGYS